MKYFYVVCFLGLLVVENVFGLQCYATDLKALKKRRLAEHHISDCNDYLLDSLHHSGLTGSYNFSESVLRCFKVVIYGASRVEVKGCTVNGGCNVAKEMFKNVVYQTGVSINECYECQGDKCNAGSPGAKIATGALFLFAAMLLL